MTTVLSPGREYRELAQNQLFGHTMASFAVAGDATADSNGLNPVLHSTRRLTTDHLRWP